VQILKQVVELTRDKCNTIANNINYQKIINLNEDEIILKYSKAFTLLTQRIMDTPRFACLSCEKLCFEETLLME